MSVLKSILQRVTTLRNPRTRSPLAPPSLPSLTASLTTLRDLLHDEPQPHVWNALCAELCSSEHDPLVFEYIAQHLDGHWPDEVRTSTPLWTNAILRGHPPEPWNLVRALSTLDRSHISNEQLQNLQEHTLHLRRLCVRFDDRNTDQLCTFLTQASLHNLTHLTLRGPLTEHHLALFTHDRLPSLQHLDLSLCSVRPSALQALCDPSSILPSLQHLNLSQNNLDTITDLLPLPSLQHLDLSQNNLSSFPSIQAPNLQHLDLSQNPNLQPLTSTPPPHLPSLQHLNLSKTTLSNTTLSWLLHTSPPLHTLNLSQNPLTLAFIQTLDDRLQPNTLHTLSIAHNTALPTFRSTTESLQTLTQSPTFASLHTLHFAPLAPNPNPPHQPRILHKPPPTHHPLRELSIARVPFALHIPALLPKLFPDLSYLSFTHSNLQDLHVGPLFTLPNLTTLDLRANPVTKRGLYALRYTTHTTHLTLYADTLPDVSTFEHRLQTLAESISLAPDSLEYDHEDSTH